MKALVMDFSPVLMFAKSPDVPSLNAHHKQLSAQPGYQLYDHFVLNTELLDYLARLSAQVPIYIFTTGALHEHPLVKPHLARAITGPSWHQTLVQRWTPPRMPLLRSHWDPLRPNLYLSTTSRPMSRQPPEPACMPCGSRRIRASLKL
jgi:hypothetical protein